MKVLLTGGCGYIGSHTCCELLNNGYDVVIIDNLENSEKTNIEKIKRITGKTVDFYEADVSDKETLRNIFIENDITAVIHLASLKDSHNALTDPIKYYRNNIDSTLTLVEVMKEFNCKKLIFSSSAEVYKSPESILPITEDFPLETLTPLSKTKFIIENILQDLYDSDNSWSIALLRYFNPIGAHKSYLLGDNTKDSKTNIMSSIMMYLSGEQEQIKVYGYDYNTPDGTSIKDYIHILDLASSHIKVLEKVLSTKELNYYNIGTGKGYSILEIIKTFERVNDVKINYKLVDRHYGDSSICYADITNTIKKLGWKPLYNLEEMCKDSYNYMKTQIERD